MRSATDGPSPSAETCARMARRAFLQKGSLGLLGAGLATVLEPPVASGQQAAGGPATAKSKLVMVKHAEATDDRGAGHPDIVKGMVDRAIREMSGKDSLGDAWREFVSPDDVVGIKVTMAGGQRLSTQPCVVRAIVAGLTAAGVKENNIIIHDASSNGLPKCGFALNDSDQGVRCYGTNRGQDVVGKNGAGDAWKQFYSDKPVPVADRQAYFSRIVTDEITALINVPVIKDHILAGMTCAMKNYYGSIMNPSELHRDYCNPYIAELNAAPPIKGKTRLIVVDGLRSVYNGGPRDNPKWRWRPNAVWMSTDPVAVDSTALRILEDKRKKAGLRPIAQRAKHVETAAKIGLGTNDPAQIDLREIDVTTKE